MHLFRSSLVMLLLLTLITGLAYPLLVTGLANLIFPWQANGSLAVSYTHLTLPTTSRG